jgi:tyrosine-protein kinase
MDLKRLLGLLRQGWLVLILAGAAGTALGLVQNALVTPTYTANATVLFTLQTRGSLSVLAEGSSYTQALMPSYTRVMETALVLQPVIDDLGLKTTPKQLAQRVTVDHEIDSVIANISVTDTTAQRAAAIANGIAAQTRVATATLSPKSSNQLGEITVTSMSTAVPADAPAEPVLYKDVIRGLLLGLGLGIAGIILWDVIVSSAVDSRIAVARVTRTPVIGMITLDPKSRQRRLPVDTQPLLPRSESFRFLQANLAALSTDSKLCLVITSARRGEGRTSTATNLAIAIALSQPESRVLLIDADLRGSAMADLLGVAPGMGLTSVMTGKIRFEDAVVKWSTQEPTARTIHFLPAGPPIAEPSDLLASTAMGQLIKRARDMYDVVLLDSAPLLDVTDGAILAAQADGAIVVVDVTKTRHRQFSESLTRMSLAGADVLGVVLNRVADVSREYRALKPARHDVMTQVTAREHVLANDVHVDGQSAAVPALKHPASTEAARLPVRTEAAKQAATTSEPATNPGIVTRAPVAKSTPVAKAAPVKPNPDQPVKAGKAPAKKAPAAKTPPPTMPLPTAQPSKKGGFAPSGHSHRGVKSDDRNQKDNKQ